MSRKAEPSAELLARVGSHSGYCVPSHPAPVDLFLASNEGRAAHGLPAPDDWLVSAEQLARYPDSTRLSSLLARELGLDPDSVLVTAGADDALFRACTAVLEPGREVVVPGPTFEMIQRYAQLAGGTLREVDWPAENFPLEAMQRALSAATALVIVVSPNNPTGQIISREQLIDLSGSAPDALFILDLAYSEFADEDLTELALTLDNVIVLRTLSKAWGLAGLRVGYALGPASLIRALFNAGNPYPVSALSLALGAARYRSGGGDMGDYVEAARSERVALAQTLNRLGARPIDSQANFVFARTPNPVWIRDALAGLGIAIRVFPGRPGLEDALRITCPGERHSFERLTGALEAAVAPEALLWDMDGVLAEVTQSFRVAIVETAASYGVVLSEDAIDRTKAEGGANDDWELTHRLIGQHDVETSLQEVTDRFERLYQGADGEPGLHTKETLLPPREILERLAKRLPMGIVTGRPRSDALRFLRDHDVEHLFRVVICREDAPLKPDPAPVRLALEQLGVHSAWMLGDTPDDIRAARSAGVVPLGVVAFESEPDQSSNDADKRRVLLHAGAARVLSRTAELEELL